MQVPDLWWNHISQICCFLLRVLNRHLLLLLTSEVTNWPSSQMVWPLSRGSLLEFALFLHLLAQSWPFLQQCGKKPCIWFFDADQIWLNPFLDLSPPIVTYFKHNCFLSIQPLILSENPRTWRPGQIVFHIQASNFTVCCQGKSPMQAVAERYPSSFVGIWKVSLGSTGRKREGKQHYLRLGNHRLQCHWRHRPSCFGEANGSNIMESINSRHGSHSLPRWDCTTASLHDILRFPAAGWAAFGKTQVPHAGRAERLERSPWVSRLERSLSLLVKVRRNIVCVFN